MKFFTDEADVGEVDDFEEMKMFSEALKRCFLKKLQDMVVLIEVLKMNSWEED